MSDTVGVAESAPQSVPETTPQPVQSEQSQAPVQKEIPNSIELPPMEDPGWNSSFNALPLETRLAIERGEIQVKEKGKETVEPVKEEPKPVENAPEVTPEDTSILDNEFQELEKLGPVGKKIQNALIKSAEDLEAAERLAEQFNPNLQQELGTLLSNPVVAYIAEAMKGNPNAKNLIVPPDVVNSYTPEMALTEEDYLSLGVDVNDHEGRKLVNGIAKKAFEIGSEKGSLAVRQQIQQEQEYQRAVEYYQKTVADMEKNIPDFSTNKQQFIQWISTDINAGRLTDKFVQDTGLDVLYQAWAIKNAGGANQWRSQFAKKVETNTRNKLLQNIENARKSAARTLSASHPTNSPNVKERYGIDLELARKDHAYALARSRTLSPEQALEFERALTVGEWPNTPH